MKYEIEDEWVSLKYLMLNQSRFELYKNKIIRLKQLRSDSTLSEECVYVQITQQNMVYNDRPCKLLIIRDVTTLKKLETA